MDKHGQGSDVDDAPYTGDLDLDSVVTREDLAGLLKMVHVRADKPSLRTLEARTRHGATPLSRSAVSDMLRGLGRPKKAVMVAFLQACGVQDDSIEQWRRAWEQVASAEARHGAQVTSRLPGQTAMQYPSQGVAEDTGPQSVRAERTPANDVASSSPSDLSQLREQLKVLTKANEQLRSQLAVKQRQAAEGSAHNDAVNLPKVSDPLVRQSVWHFPDGSPITLVSYRLPIDRRPPSADPEDPNYVRISDLADLDTLFDIYGAIRAYNPMSRVDIKAAQDLTQPDVRSHLVLIGGLTWEAVTPWFSRIFSIPIVAGDPFEHGAIMVHDPDNGEHEFHYTIDKGRLVEDVGFFACGNNPSAPRRKLTICGGITTRGVRGAALCFIDWEIRENNERYVAPRLPIEAAYCLVMRVPILNGDPLAPDLSKNENRLFEWHNSTT